MSTEVEQTAFKQEIIDEKTCKWFDLKPNRDLLDFNFDGYKLSLDSVAKYTIDLEKENFNLIDICHQNEIKTSKPLLYQHIKLFGFHNHLFQNEFLNLDINFKSDEFKSLYYFDTNWSLIKIEFNNVKRYLRKTNLKLEKNSTTFYNERVNITMKFLNKKLAIICDGCEMIYLCEIESDDQANDHENEEKWKILFKYNLEQHKCINSVIKDANLVELSQNLFKLNLILMSIHEKDENHSYETIINCLTFENDADNLTKWLFKDCTKINCFHTVPEYVSLGRRENADNAGDEHVVVLGSSLIKFLDENGEVIVEKKPEVSTAVASVQSKYEWNEQGHDVNVFVNLNEKNINKNDLKVNITENNLEILYKNEVYLKDTFYSPTVKSESVWQMDSKEGTIEITLKKKETLMWSTLFKSGDKLGKYKETGAKSNEPIIEEIKTDKENGSEGNKIFNLNRDLEECDGILNDEQQQMTNDALIEAAIEKDQETLVTEEDLQMIMYLNLKKKNCDLRSYVTNNKYLFQTQLNTRKSPAVCLRHDVDGILWQPENLKTAIDANFTHIHTFLAFGYVQASKQNSKFQSASPNCSYVCICETSRHLYIYKHRSEVMEDTTLRNRKTGKTYTHVSKQFVVSIDSVDEIMGIYCSNEFIVVLLQNTIYFVQVNA